MRREFSVVIGQQQALDLPIGAARLRGQFELAEIAIVKQKAVGLDVDLRPGVGSADRFGFARCNFADRCGNAQALQARDNPPVRAVRRFGLPACAAGELAPAQIDLPRVGAMACADA